ncbi:MAG TPA: class I SAM-dependent methyltransferase [Steroidobacteraceae bacterium]|nr:class I SAM-dependent methyltransferase [Steroidobacteraceae bacterium]
MAAEPQLAPQVFTPAERTFTARAEPFDTYWQGTRNLNEGFRSFATYYRVNYLPRLPADRAAKIVVTSCGPGYLVNALVQAGYRNVVGIDADAEKIKHARERSLPCAAASAFPYLEAHPNSFDVIIPEQELNHLTLEETIDFLAVCKNALRPGGQLLAYAINGANPLVAPEHISHNVDHFYNVTEYSFRQLLQITGFMAIQPFACKLYVFWDKPLNYVGWAVTHLMEAVLRGVYRLYGENVSILSKRIAVTAHRPA